MRHTARMPTATKLFSVEWSPNVAAVQDQLLPAASHFVLPDLPDVFTDQDRIDFVNRTEPEQRIYTIATCQHDSAESLLKSASDIDPTCKILLVGGNHRGPNSMSSMEAAKVLRNEKENHLWGVANPNDLNSMEAFEKKLESGMCGFITQPLLSSHAKDTMQMYRGAAKDATILAGMAFPKTIKGLRFWAKLLDQELELEKDPLFQSHIAYFSQPYVTPIAWIGRELQDLLVVNNNADDNFVDGIHFMPLKNIQDLCTIFRSLNHAHRPSLDKGVC